MFSFTIIIVFLDIIHHPVFLFQFGDNDYRDRLGPTE
jgi:hypothetical protein